VQAIDMTQMTPETELLTVPEVMARLKVGRHKVYDLIRSHQLRSVKVGGSRRVPVTELRTYLSLLLEENN
jgi:excisionase family DNA binding protein